MQLGINATINPFGLVCFKLQTALLDVLAVLIQH